MTHMKLMTLVAALTLTPSAALAQTQVTLLFWPGPESEAMQKVVDGYNAGPGKKDGVNVKQILFSRQGYFDKELTDLAAGSKDFDLALVTNLQSGALRAVSGTAKKLRQQGGDRRLPAVRRAISDLQSTLYGVPTDVSNHFTYYRKDLTEPAAERRRMEGEIRRDHPKDHGQEDDPQSSRRLDLGRLRRHGDVLH